MLSSAPKVQDSVDVRVVDARNDAPIANASVLYVVRDVHSTCAHANHVQATATSDGRVKIQGRRQWGVWYGVPGGMPVPIHFIAIWAPGYAAFVEADYSDTRESVRRDCTARRDVLEALESIPDDESSTDPSINPKGALKSGRIRLRLAAP